MAESVPNLMKNINQQTEKNEQNLNTTNTKKTIARNIIVKLLKTKDFFKKTEEQNSGL